MADYLRGKALSDATYKNHIDVIRGLEDLHKELEDYIDYDGHHSSLYGAWIMAGSEECFHNSISDGNLYDIKKECLLVLDKIFYANLHMK